MNHGFWDDFHSLDDQSADLLVLVMLAMMLYMHSARNT